MFWWPFQSSIPVEKYQKKTVEIQETLKRCEGQIDDIAEQRSIAKSWNLWHQVENDVWRQLRMQVCWQVLTEKS